MSKIYLGSTEITKAYVGANEVFSSAPPAVATATTLWFVTGSTARAYTAATRARDSSKDITLASRTYRNAVSDGTTLWFVSGVNLIAYNASTRARDSAKDFSLSSEARWISASVSDGTTIWLNTGRYTNTQAYTAATRTLDLTKRYAQDRNLDAAAYANGTMWWADGTRAVAINTTTRSTDPGKDFVLLTRDATDGTSDGVTLWFLYTNGTVQAYNSVSRARDSAKDISLGSGTWVAAVAA